MSDWIDQRAIAHQSLDQLLNGMEILEPAHRQVVYSMLAEQMEAHRRVTLHLLRYLQGEIDRPRPAGEVNLDERHTDPSGN